MAKVLVTGGGGFIGSHLVDAFLAQGDEVSVFDNFSTGSKDNLSHVRGRIQVIEEDLRDFQAIAEACKGIDFVVHQAALGSVPRSIDNPRATHEVNATGTLNALVAAKEAGVKRFVHASSSSIYGDTPELPKRETMAFHPKSPYALSKVAAEEYTRIFFEVYGMETIALRYFNVFGPRQSPRAAYAAVIPLFTEAILEGRAPKINGDGKHTRDFTYVENVVFANVCATQAPKAALGRAYNIGANGQYSLIDLVAEINKAAGKTVEPEFGPPRPGDVVHSFADVHLAKEMLGYEVKVPFAEGIRRTVEYHQQMMALS